jgi:purine nucleosidase
MSRVACSMVLVSLAVLALPRAPSAVADDHGEQRDVPLFIIDTDMDNDDGAAIAYMCQEHLLGHVRLLGVTITNNGVGLPGKAIKHTRCLLKQCGLPGLPVADASLPAPNAFPDSIRDGVNQTLDNVFADCNESEAPSAISAPELLQRLADKAHGKVNLLATGPLSNVAAALDESHQGRDGRRESFRDHIGTAFIMGGSVHVGGNLCCGVSGDFDNSQEFNFWTDPAAVRDVFHKLRPATVALVPLDATNFVPLTTSFDAVLEANPRTGAAEFVAAMVADPGVADSVPDGFLFWWDPLAAVAATTNNVVSYETDRLTVVQSGPSMGALVIDRAGDPVRVGIAADPQKFEGRFLAILNAATHHHGR